MGSKNLNPLNDNSLGGLLDRIFATINKLLAAETEEIHIDLVIRWNWLRAQHFAVTKSESDAIPILKECLDCVSRLPKNHTIKLYHSLDCNEISVDKINLLLDVYLSRSYIDQTIAMFASKQYDQVVDRLELLLLNTSSSSVKSKLPHAEEIINQLSFEKKLQLLDILNQVSLFYIVNVFYRQRFKNMPSANNGFSVRRS